MRDLLRSMAGAAVAFALVVGGVAQAATTQLSDIPLAAASTATVLPNIFFVLDDSTSMSESYMPDGVKASDIYCSAANTIYYNPMLTYVPPRKSDGKSKKSYDKVTDWKRVPVDGYLAQSRARVDLTLTDKVSGAAEFSFYYTEGTSTSTVWCEFENLTKCQTDEDKGHPYKKTTTTTSNCALRVDITPATQSYPGPGDIKRSYAEEMTNFANWKAWYSTRMQLMKTAMSLAFVGVRGLPDANDSDDKNHLHARIGFTTISNAGAADGPTFLAIDYFGSDQKKAFYDRLFAVNPPQDPILFTPLRGALAKAGRIYAGMLGPDPIQYSCQRNFTLLTTDGYWNDYNETTQYGPYREDNATEVGDQDGASTATRPEFDALGKANTLADIAYYYYHTDLRSGTCTTCADNVPPAGTDGAVDDVENHQHMTTFTIGMGVSGKLGFVDGYKSSTAADNDYLKIKQGAKDWPDPIQNEMDERIDDLWHAAVNGRGTYFSAGNAQSLVAGLTAALGAIKDSGGSGAAAATSNLQPTSGDNFVYIANYRSPSWDGELTAYTIELDKLTGAISTTSSWQAAGLLQKKIDPAGNSDTRRIYQWSGKASDTPKNLKSFSWEDLSATERGYFDTARLSQSVDWNKAYQAAATGETLVNYLRGQDRNEDQDRAADYGSYFRLYRDRQKVLGDIVHSQPVYVKVPFYDYLDPGYAAFKLAQEQRLPTVYVAANDGMLHAFDAADGAERWAYVPPTALREMVRLADKNYPTNHRFYVDGPIAVSDIWDGDSWRTILVGGLGKGGRGFYAVDITDPANPQGLWNYTADNDPNVGYSYGLPVITKLADGTWVVVLTSGYNNVPEGSSYSGADGRGHVFVLDAATGERIRDIDTGVGSTTIPAGLAHLNVRVNDFQRDNTAQRAYGGDLLGNLWRFNLDTGAFSQVIELGSQQPITVAPEIGEIDGNTALFFGTGRYLGVGDLSDTTTQSFYAVRDDGKTTINAGNIGTLMVKQTMANTSGREVTGESKIDWTVKYGWYLDLPANKERVNLAAQLYFGTILFASTIPEATDCQPGGSGVIYALDARSGFRVADAKQNAWLFASPVVGVSVIKLPGASGKTKFYGITADGGVPQGVPPDLPTALATSGGDSGWRVMWRELTD